MRTSVIHKTVSTAKGWIFHLSIFGAFKEDMAISTVHHLFLVSAKIDLYASMLQNNISFGILYVLHYISFCLKQSVSLIRSHLNRTINTQVVHDSALTLQRHWPCFPESLLA